MHDQCIRVVGLNPLDQTILLVNAATRYGEQASRLVYHKQCVIGVDQAEPWFGYSGMRS